MNSLNKLFCALVSTSLLVTPAAFAADPNAGAAVPTALPAPQVVGDVTFITGGIGDEERMAIEQNKKDYNLYITNASTDGAFAGTSRVVVTNSSGATVLDTMTAGPLFYAKLPAGSYKVTSTLKSTGDMKTSNITVGAGKSANLEQKWAGVPK